MARPQKKGIDYFSHDVDMSEDLKIKKLEAKFGLTGYAIWNKLLELIYKSGGEFNLKNDDDLLLVAKAWGIKKEKITEIISYCVHLGLFESDNLISDAIRKRIKVVEDARQVKREKYNSSVSKPTSEIVSAGRNSLNEGFRQGETPQSKVKESKEKKCIGETHTLEFEAFHNHVKIDKDYKKLSDYDLEYYYNKVNGHYLGNNFSLSEMKAKIWFFIDNDKNSDIHKPVMAAKPKIDPVKVAFELVEKNLEWIKSLPDKNPDEVIPELIKKCSSPATKNALFEAYVEKAYKHYLAN